MPYFSPETCGYNGELNQFLKSPHMTQEFLLHNSWLIVLAVGSGMMLFWPMLNRGGGNRISVAQATLLINQKKAVLLDVREPDVAEKMGRVVNAKAIEIKELKDKAPSLVKNKAHPIVVLCQTGQRSGAAAAVLKATGYTEVYVLDGGINAWAEAGMPIKKSKAA